jgi:hypothetical protein
MMRDRAAPAGGVAASGIYATGLTGGTFASIRPGLRLGMSKCRASTPRSSATADTTRPGNTTKRCPSYLDMIVKLRRVLIVIQYQPEAAHQPTPDEIRAVRLAWAQVAA